MAQAFPERAEQLLVDGDPPAVAWAKMGDAEGLARCLLRAREAGGPEGAEQAVEARDARGWNALMWSCRGFPYEGEGGSRAEESAGSIRAGRDRCAELLVEAGADVDAETADTRYRPVVWAARDGRPRALAALLAAGADPAPHTRAGASAVAGAYEGGCDECLDLLVEAGAFGRMEPDRLWELLKSAGARRGPDHARRAARLLGALGLGAGSWAWARLVEFSRSEPSWSGAVMALVEAEELSRTAPAGSRGSPARL